MKEKRTWPNEALDSGCEHHLHLLRLCLLQRRHLSLQRVHPVEQLLNDFIVAASLSEQWCGDRKNRQ